MRAESRTRACGVDPSGDMSNLLGTGVATALAYAAFASAAVSFFFIYREIRCHHAGVGRGDGAAKFCRLAPPSQPPFQDVRSRISRHRRPYASTRSISEDANAAYSACRAGWMSSSVVGRRSGVALASEAAATAAAVPCADDVMSRAMSSDGFVLARAVSTTDLVRHVQSSQEALPLAAAALGRAMTCSLLLADGLKGDEAFQVRFNGDGPLRGVLAIANGDLEVRAYCGNPRVTLPPNENGKLDVGGGVGKGALFVVKTSRLPGSDELTPYSSVTAIRSGEIPEDINHYLAESEQREGGLAAGVHVNGEGVVDAAGGWSVELLPGAPDEVAAKLSENLSNLPPPTTLAREGHTPRAVLEMIMQDMTPSFFPNRPVSFKCRCSRERVFRTLALLPRSEVDDILEKNDVVETRCEFCATVYKLEPDEVRNWLAREAEGDGGTQTLE